jgi:hypothetical protein
MRAIRAPVAPQSVRFLSGVEDAGKTWKRKKDAIEEQYFNKVEAEKRRSLSEKIHASELRELLSIIGDKHNLTEHQIHDILEWKHKD